MSHTIFRFFTLLLMIIANTAVLAQTSEPDVLAESELANARALIHVARKETIDEELRLTKEEEAAFWPLYEKYRREMLTVLDRYAELITDYVTMYHNQKLTNEYADSLISDYFDIKSDLLRIQKKYVRRYRNILPSMKVARFYQLENKMNADIDAELALAVPLLDPN